MSLLFRKRKEPSSDRRRSLDSVAIVNNGVTVEPRDDGTTDVTVRLIRGKGFFARFQPAEIKRRFELDELGSFVIQQIDGRRPVIEIVDAFVQRFRTNRQQAELSVVAFLKMLTARRVISIAVR